LSILVIFLNISRPDMVDTDYSLYKLFVSWNSSDVFLKNILFLMPNSFCAYASSWLSPFLLFSSLIFFFSERSRKRFYMH